MVGDAPAVAGDGPPRCGQHQQRPCGGERRGDEQAGSSLPRAPSTRWAVRRPGAADDLPDEPVDFRLCHAGSVAARADVRLTLGRRAVRAYARGVLTVAVPGPVELRRDGAHLPVPGGKTTEVLIRPAPGADGPRTPVRNLWAELS